MEKAETRTLLREARQARGMAASELARLVGISRQTVYAIEDGSYVPNTAVALQLARVLEVRVEDLFSLQDGPLPAKTMRAEMVGTEQPIEGVMVRLCRVNQRLLAIPTPAVATYFPAADAIAQEITGRMITVDAALADETFERRILIAGCDPALSLLTDTLAASGIEVVTLSCPSQEALRLLKRGRVHAAGSHLLDRASGGYNLPMVHRMFAAGSVQVVTFASWEQGLVLQPGNPKEITSVADLHRRSVRMINREAGSGSRDLLDNGLLEAGIAADRVRGYDGIAHGHLPAAYAVAAGQADCCIASRSAARRFGLGFIPLSSERFDLTFSHDALQLPSTKALLDLLNRTAFRNKLRALAGYETAQTGMVQA